MTREERDFMYYWERVRAGDYPDNPRVPLPPRFTNGAGMIQNLTERVGPSFVSVIESERRSLRSNHFHVEDWHFLYVVIGGMLYYERPMTSRTMPEPLYFGPGQLVFTGPKVEHATAFTEETTLVSISKRARTTAEHAADLVPVNFVTREMLGWA